MIDAASGITVADSLAALAGLRGVSRAATPRQVSIIQPAAAVPCRDGDCGQDRAEISETARRLAGQSAGALTGPPAAGAATVGGVLDVTV